MDDPIELANQLLAIAGTIMEDASVAAVITASDTLENRIEATRQAGQQILILAQASAVFTDMANGA